MSANAGDNRGSAGFSCLMVEDDPAFAAMVAQVVREEGGEPTHCKTLAEARTATADRAFDLVLLDNHLPDGKEKGSGHRSVHLLANSVFLSLNILFFSLLHPGVQVSVGSLGGS